MVHNPKAPGEVERVDPTTRGSAGTVDTDNTTKRSALTSTCIMAGAAAYHLLNEINRQQDRGRGRGR